MSKRSGRPRWFLFADDAGDPGEQGSAHFGYCVLAIERAAMHDFVRARSEFRARRQRFGESKRGDILSAGFRETFTSLDALFSSGDVRLASSFITVARYRGPWLREQNGIPRSPNWLRNYLIRKTVELMFDDYESIGECTAELVVDRVRYRAEQLTNMVAYLGGAFTERGSFQIPRITDVTHADSLYVDALQVADHASRLVRRLHEKPEVAERVLQQYGRYLRVQNVLGGGAISIHEAARNAL